MLIPTEFFFTFEDFFSEAVTQMYSVKKVLSQISQENTGVGVSF